LTMRQDGLGKEEWSQQPAATEGKPDKKEKPKRAASGKSK